MYESRPSSYKHEGSIVLAANGLRILDILDPGLYKRLCHHGFSFDETYILNEASEIVGGWPIGGEIYDGFHGMRIFRRHVLRELSQLCNKRGVPIVHEKKFSHVVSRSPGSLDFAFADGSKARASILVGADGRHSSVRHHIFPSAQEKYFTTSVAFFCPKSVLRGSLPLPCRMNTKAEQFGCAPVDPAGNALMAFEHFPIPEPEGDLIEGWEKVAKDTETLVGLLTRNQGVMPDVCQSALENISTKDMELWSYYTMPELDTWISAGTEAEKQSDLGRVLLIGDAAHDVPPASGQRPNQIFEDGYTLACMLSFVSESISLGQALTFWENWRMERIAKTGQLAKYKNSIRPSLAEQENLEREEKQIEEWDDTKRDFFQWLYMPKLDEEMLTWVREQEKR